MTLADLNRIARFPKRSLVLSGIAGAVAWVVFFGVPLKAAQARQAVIAVKGLSCPVCAHRLEKVLAKLPGAEKAQVDLGKSQAVVDFAPNSNVTDKEIGQKVRDSGFVPGKIQWRALPVEKKR
jgi:copper chaperone CopZ